MGKPYSDDLRERVVAAIEAGRTRVEVAELYNMALSAVGGFIKRKRETGSVRPDKFGGYKTFALEDHTARSCSAACMLNRGSRRACCFPAGLQPGSQSHRTTLRKTQIILTQNEGVEELWRAIASFLKGV